MRTRGVVLYLAVVQGGYKLIGSKGQLRPFIEVHSPAHVVKMLEIEDGHCGKTKCAQYIYSNRYLFMPARQ